MTTETTPELPPAADKTQPIVKRFWNWLRGYDQSRDLGRIRVDGVVRIALDDAPEMTIGGEMEQLAGLVAMAIAIHQKRTVIVSDTSHCPWRIVGIEGNLVRLQSV